MNIFLTDQPTFGEHAHNDSMHIPSIIYTCNPLCVSTLFLAHIDFWSSRKLLFLYFSCLTISLAVLLTGNRFESLYQYLHAASCLINLEPYVTAVPAAVDAGTPLSISPVIIVVNNGHEQPHREELLHLPEPREILRCRSLLRIIHHDVMLHLSLHR
jgi:hypothetical protein